MEPFSPTSEPAGTTNDGDYVSEMLAVRPASSLCHRPVTEPTLETFASGPNSVVKCSLLVARCLVYSSALETSVNLQ
jgi:hypothetical protein